MAQSQLHEAAIRPAYNCLILDVYTDAKVLNDVFAVVWLSRWQCQTFGPGVLSMKCRRIDGFRSRQAAAQACAQGSAAPLRMAQLGDISTKAQQDIAKVAAFTFSVATSAFTVLVTTRL